MISRPISEGPGALAGFVILDLSRSIAGAIATMLLADQGASVTKVEPPGGDPVRQEAGAQVWLRNKRSAVVDLPAERELVLRLAARADVIIDSWTPKVAAAHGVADADLAAANPRLVRCSITGYGADTRHADRPDDPYLVAARTGLVWEQRGWPGGAIARMSRSAPNLPELVPSPGCWDGTDRPGPIMPAIPQPALAAAYLGAIAVTAALHARKLTGRGQRVETSLLQGVLAATWGAWQRAEHPQVEGYDSWVFDSRATRGMFECADGTWVCHWMPRPGFVLGVSAGDELIANPDVPSIHEDPLRIMPTPQDLVVLHHYYPALSAAFRRFPAAEWERVAAELGVALQPIRSPEQALADPRFDADGSTITVDDPVRGPVRQAGYAIRLSKCPPPSPTPPPRLGRHDEEVRSLAARPAAEPSPAAGNTVPLAGPLAGITVLDLGLAVAGPWGTQLLSDLGARVIKINRKSDAFWHSGHMAMACNRGKSSLAVNLKKPAGLALLRRLAARVDVIHHNMRADAARRLGVWYDDVRELNPGLIYCHTTGFDDTRATLPGNDQTGAALAGVLYEDGGCANGGRPTWSLTSLGDIGNGFLSALGVLQALVHRDRTGEGQLVNTSIVRAQLLAASSAWLAGDGTPAARDRLERDQLGFSALRRLYQTREGWIGIAVRTDDQWRGLCEATGRRDLAAEDALATALARHAQGRRLWSLFEEVFKTRGASEWFERLDAAGVPCEVCDENSALGVFDDPELIARSWVVGYRQGLVGHLEHLGLLFDFSETPARIAGPPLMVGDSSRSVLSEMGWSDAEIAELIEARVIYDLGAQQSSVVKAQGSAND